MNLEEKAIAEGFTRVKFKCRWVGSIKGFLDGQLEVARKVRELQESLADALVELEEIGATPVAPDGKVGGNAAAVFTMDERKYLLVTMSGKLANKRMDPEKDFCIITSFNVDDWSAEYAACGDNVLPTSDTPLHYYGLMCNDRFDWEERPEVVLHGHALETEEEAHKLNFPISTKETLFSTKEDSDALMELMEEFPYPTNTIFIRKGHGFLLYGSCVTQTVDIFRTKMKPHIHLMK